MILSYGVCWVSIQYFSRAFDCEIATDAVVEIQSMQDSESI